MPHFGRFCRIVAQERLRQDSEAGAEGAVLDRERKENQLKEAGMIDTVRLEKRGDHYWIILERPEALNALNEKMVTELARILREISSDGRPLIITGRGRAFSAGGDLKGYL